MHLKIIQLGTHKN